MTSAVLGAVFVVVVLVGAAMASRRRVVREIVATWLFVALLSLCTCGFRAGTRVVLWSAAREGNASEEFVRGVHSLFDSLTGLQLLLVALGGGIFVLSVWRRDES
jgi:hypothetical protein